MTQDTIRMIPTIYIYPVNSISPRASSVFVPRGISVDITLLDFLSKRFPHIGEEIWKHRIEEGKVRFGDGTVAFAPSKVGPGMKIQYFREVPAEPRIVDAHQILYQDVTTQRDIADIGFTPTRAC